MVSAKLEVPLTAKEKEGPLGENKKTWESVVPTFLLIAALSLLTYTSLAVHRSVLFGRTASGTRTAAIPRIHKLQHITQRDGANFTLLAGSIRSFSQGVHNVHQQPRTCLCLLATPPGMSTLRETMQLVFTQSDNDDGLYHYEPFDCIHLTLTDQAIRFSPDQVYDTAGDFLPFLMEDPRLIVHRLFDHGPLTEYMGPASLEQHPDTSLTFLKLSELVTKTEQVRQVLAAATDLDKQAFWCLEGENFLWKSDRQSVVSKPVQMQNVQVASEADTCRGSPLLLRRRHFDDFLWNQTDYHSECAKEKQGRWLSFQVHRQDYPVKVIRDETLNRNKMMPHRKFRKECTLAWLEAHPRAYASLQEEIRPRQ
jgi:hypothetical protein